MRMRKHRAGSDPAIRSFRFCDVRAIFRSTFVRRVLGPEPMPKNAALELQGSGMLQYGQFRAPARFNGTRSLFRSRPHVEPLPHVCSYASMLSIFKTLARTIEF